MHCSTRRLTAGLIGLTLAITACGADDDGAVGTDSEPDRSTTTAAPTTAPHWLRGEVVHRQEPFSQSYPDGIPFGPGSHVVITVSRLPYNMADTSAEPVAEIRIDDVDGFPIVFEFPDVVIEPPPPGISPEYEYHVDAIVRLGEEPREFVGDLVKQARYVITDSIAPTRVEVVGLEDCDAPNSGGYCVSGLRPD